MQGPALSSTCAGLAALLTLGACAPRVNPGDTEAETSASSESTQSESGAQECIAELLVVDADITTDTVWESCKTYILDRIVVVEGATLTIDPGTEIRGRHGSSLVIEKDAMLIAAGTPDAPIVFTSDATEDPRRGDWGGLVLLGNATTNIGTGQAEGFPVPRTYGGEDDSHSCGTLEYVRVEYAGIAIDVTLNAITFYACGSGTTVHHLQSHMGLDDGIEVFGGTFDMDHIVVTGAADDAIDLDQGYRGQLDFVFIHQDPDVGDNCFEVSNQGTDFAAEPRTEPDFCNATCVGSGAGGEKSKGLTVKEGAYGHWDSSIFVLATNEATLLADDATADEALADNITLVNNYFFGNGEPTHNSESTTVDQPAWDMWVMDEARANQAADPGLGSADWGAPNVVPANDVSASGACETSYAGAVDPAGDDWTQASWINYTP